MKSLQAARDRPDRRARGGHRGDPRRRSRAAAASTAPGLHDGLRERVRDELLPWCKGCQSNHVSPMLWRYAGVAAGMRMDSERRFRAGRPGRRRKRADLARAYLRFYGPAEVKGFADWARPGAGAGPAALGRDRRRAGGGRVEGRQGLDRRGRPPRARLAAAGLGHAPDPAARPVPAAGRPRDARARCRGAQAALPRRREPRRRAARRRPGGDVEGEGRPRRPARRSRSSASRRSTATSSSASAHAWRSCAAPTPSSSPSPSARKPPTRRCGTHTVQK